MAPAQIPPMGYQGIVGYPLTAPRGQALHDVALEEPGHPMTGSRVEIAAKLNCEQTVSTTD